MNTITKCPTCGEEVDSHGAIEKSDGDINATVHLVSKPEEGDFTVCAGCKAVGVFDNKGQIQVPTIKQLREMPPAVQGMITTVLDLMDSIGNK